MEACIDLLGNATIISTLDANSRYWKVEIAEEDRDKTAFTSHYGLFHFTRMPFGLKNDPGTFQRANDVLDTKVKQQFAFIYIDYIVMDSCRTVEYIDHVGQILKLFDHRCLTLNLKKCEFSKNPIHYLGHVLRPVCIEVSTLTTDAIHRLEYPTTVTENR